VPKSEEKGAGGSKRKQLRIREIYESWIEIRENSREEELWEARAEGVGLAPGDVRLI